MRPGKTGPPDDSTAPVAAHFGPRPAAMYDGRMTTWAALRGHTRAGKAWLPLTMLLAAPTAGAEPACIAPVYVWELELTRVERLAGAVDPNDVAASLGRIARLRGGYHDPAKPRLGPRADLMGSDEGAGLHVTLEKLDP